MVLKIIGGVVIAILVLIGLGFVLSWIYPDMNFRSIGSMRDLAVVLMSFFSCIGSILFAVLIGVLIWIGLIIKNNVGPLLDNAADTARTAKGTAVFVSEGVVTPIIKVAGAAAGVKAAVQSLFQRKPKPTEPPK